MDLRSQTEISAAVLNESKPLVAAIIFKLPFSRVLDGYLSFEFISLSQTATLNTCVSAEHLPRGGTLWNSLFPGILLSLVLYYLGYRRR